jgi:hypothetical protein
VALNDYWQAPALCLKVRGAGSRVLEVGAELAGAGVAQLTWTYWVSTYAAAHTAGVGLVLVVWEVISPEGFPLDDYVRGIFASGTMVGVDAFVVSERHPLDMVLAEIGEAHHDYVRAIQDEVRDGLRAEGERIAKQRAKGLSQPSGLTRRERGLSWFCQFCTDLTADEDLCPRCWAARAKVLERTRSDETKRDPGKKGGAS